MHKRLKLALRLSTSAMVFSGYLALASVADYSLSLLFLPLLLILLSPLAERLDARFPLYREIFKGITILYCAFIPFSYLTWGALESVIVLTMYIQANLMLHQKEERFYHYIFLMSFFLVLSACVQQPEALIGFALALFLVSAVWSISCFRLLLETDQQGEESTAEIVPLRPGRMGDLEGRSTGFDFNVVLNVLMVSVATVLLTMALFVVTPRMEAGWFGNTNQIITTTGLSEEVDLLGSGMVQEDATAVMLVKFPGTPDGRYSENDLYWRSTTFPRFQNSKWTRSELYDHLVPGVRPLQQPDGTRTRRYSMTELQRSQRYEFELVHTDVYLDQVGEYGIPCLDLVQSVGLKTEYGNFSITWDRYQDFTIEARSTGTRRLGYEAWSEINRPTPEQLRASSEDYSEISAWDLRMLLDQNLSEQPLAIARELTEDAPTVYDKAVAIEQWLSGTEFLYTLDLPQLPPESAIDAFLMQTRVGHCELFASAMALMLRSLGIPTRVVNGYRGGEWSETDRAYTIRQYMAHLWVEVYFPDYGWVRFDPSPAGEIAGSRLSQFARMIANYTLKTKMFWYQDVVGFSGGLRMVNRQAFSWRGLGIQDRGVPEAVTVAQGRGGIGWRPHPLLPVVVMMAVAIVLLRRKRGPAAPAKRRFVLTPDQQRVITLYNRLRKKLIKQGASCVGKTAEELEAELIEHGWLQPAPAVELLHVYNEVRFGGRGLTREQYATLKRQLRGLQPPAPACSHARVQALPRSLDNA